MPTTWDAGPFWLNCLVLFVVLSAAAMLARIFVGRLSESTRDEVESQASSMISGFAAAFAFFTGVAITMTWGALSSAQSAVEDLTAKSQQVGWAIGNLGNEAAADQLQGKLTDYLQAVIGQDAPALAAGTTGNMPSAEAMDKLQDAIHTYSYAPGTPASESGALVSSIQALGTSNSTLAAVAERSMPVLMGVLLMVVATLLSITLGLSSASVKRPFLTILWCFVIALSISLVFALDHPFGGAITVNLGPLVDYANSS